VALVADDAQEPVRQDPALEKCLDLLEHEPRQLGLGAAAHLGEERAPVRLDCPVEERVLWAVALVLRGGSRCDGAGCQGAAIGHLDSSEERRSRFRPHPLGPPPRKPTLLAAHGRQRSRWPVGWHAARGPETPTRSPAPVCVPSASASEMGERHARWQQFALIAATPLKLTKSLVLRSELLS
jgi:hypothetical protein